MPTKYKDELLKKLKMLKPEILKSYKVKEIGLFGSFARGEQSKTSDIDILVDFDERADLFDLIGLSHFLEDKLRKKVDVVPKTALRKELREEIFQELVIL